MTERYLGRPLLRDGGWIADLAEVRLALNHRHVLRMPGLADEAD
jgi:hypothetical protein